MITHYVYCTFNGDVEFAGSLEECEEFLEKYPAQSCIIVKAD